MTMAYAASHKVTVESLRSMSVFADLPAPALDQLLRVSQIRNLGRSQRLSSLVRSEGESYCFVLSGIVSIAVDRQGAAIPVVPSDQHPFEYIGFFSPGELFSDGFLDYTPGTGEPVLDCMASTPSTLLAASRPALTEIMSRHAAWSQWLSQQIAASRTHFLSQQEPTRRLVQDFFLRHGYASSSRVRVSQLDRCLDCNKCEEACAERHGSSRMARAKLHLGRLDLPQVCRNCVDKSCLAACSFGALVVDDSGDLRISDRCKGCGACAHKCPNGAIFMIQVPYSLTDFPEPIPTSDARGMTNVPGLFVAGDVSGAALIKLSMNESVRAIDHLAPRRTPREDKQVLDVVVVGAGPAGLAAALRCRERQLDYLVLEKDRSLSTIWDYPKHKLVMAEPSNVPLASALWFGDCTKEELLSRWQAAIAQERLRVREGSEVKRIARQPDGSFMIELAEGVYFAENVLVCVGKRGSPRRLGVAGEEPSRVRYNLSDPDAFGGQHALVVGGGDSAVEAALALADVPDTTVTLSYRQAAFSRIKAGNRDRLQDYQTRGRVSVVLSSTVRALEPGRVRLATPSGETVLPNQIVFALLGADPPTSFLEQAGIHVLQPKSPDMASYAASRGMHQRAVKCDHCAGFSDQACLRACPTGALTELAPQEVFVETKIGPTGTTWNFSGVAFLEGIAEHRARQTKRTSKGVVAALLILALAAIGIESFLRATLPEHSFQALLLRWLGMVEPISFSSGKGFGHWLGYIGTSFMLLTFLYPLHTRLGLLKNLGTQSSWLAAHLWMGFIGATLVTYHAAFKLDRWAGLSCISMWIVVAAGAIGRYLFGMVHSGIGLADFEKESLTRSITAMAGYRGESRAMRILARDYEGAVKSHGLIAVMLWHELRDFVVLLWLRFGGLSDVPDRKTRRQILHFLSDRAAQRRTRSYLESAKKMLRHWNWIHIALTIIMFALAGVHIAYGFMYKAV
jgi:thioredoxin reductase/Fe-S-cluster-containing dehydrogenase component